MYYKLINVIGKEESSDGSNGEGGPPTRVGAYNLLHNTPSSAPYTSCDLDDQVKINDLCLVLFCVQFSLFSKHFSSLPVRNRPLKKMIREICTEEGLVAPDGQCLVETTRFVLY